MMQLKVAIATLAMLFGMSTATFAQFDEPLNQSTSPPSQTFDRPDADINVDPNSTNQKLDTTTTTRVETTTVLSADLEANRKAELAALNPHFILMLNEMADVLDADQASTLQGMAVSMDLVELASMDADDQVAFLAYLTQRLNLRGNQVDSFRGIIAEHIGEMNKLHVGFMNREQEILSTRRTTTTVISAPAESTTVIEQQETTTTTTTTEVAPAPAPAPRSEVRGTQQQQREFIRNQDLK